jgi:hypothetical protein
VHGASYTLYFNKGTPQLCGYMRSITSLANSSMPRVG